MELGDTAYAFRWLQEGHTTEALCERLNRRWLPHLVHWPVKYEARELASGKNGWVEEKDKEVSDGDTQRRR